MLRKEQEQEVLRGKVASELSKPSKLGLSCGGLVKPGLCTSLLVQPMKPSKLGLSCGGLVKLGLCTSLLVQPMKPSKLGLSCGGLVKL